MKLNIKVETQNTDRRKKKSKLTKAGESVLIQENPKTECPEEGDL